MVAIYVKNSENAKTGKCDATYVTTHSCPDTCAFKNKGCYVDNSYCGIIIKRLNQTKSLTATQIARAEAKQINSVKKPGEYLRLHVSGDCRTIEGVRVINNSIKNWKQRGGKTCWSYTHAWDKILREQWSNVEILASINNISEAKAARENGYAPALVVEKHKSNKAYKLPGSDVLWIPCLSQTKDKTCRECKLCFNVDKLYKNNMGVAFEAHGVKRKLLVVK